ncbi:FAD-dependent oxidoreductase [Cyclobacterium xiamenense]|uniref:FAD-dependent oxidoreductase n=1 Tax=Cyclobacterium xiamenense TaxID=1297121 RepID=UPI0035CF699E
MLVEGPFSGNRSLTSKTLTADLLVVGGGMAGICAAITAARQGMEVVLVQDRPVLGGNASSEIRLWILGATSSMGNNNRWAREGGVIDEILLENQYRNPEGNALILDTVLLEKVTQETNITLLLNTAVNGCEKEGDNRIAAALAFCSQNSTQYRLEAPLFVDASGDGILGYLSGAAYRIGAESREEFDEAFAPEKAYGELLGHSLYFHSKDSGKPVQFIPPAFANTDLPSLPRFHTFNLHDRGCRLWWVEYGGRMDTIHDTETIKWELWRIIYGIWHHIKNSGEYLDMETHTLEWVGMIPGKRESRRFEGDYMLSQRDVVEQRTHPDRVSYGGWALDLHPADGIYGELPGCTQWHAKGVYGIPFRCLYSRNIENLFLAGRIISASHVAFGSSRVMATCAHNAQAVGMAAALCKERHLLPRDLLEEELMEKLQQRLMGMGQYLPGMPLRDTDNLAKTASVSVSSTFSLQQLPADAGWKALDSSMAQLLPLEKGRIPVFTFVVKAKKASRLVVRLLHSSLPGNFTPDRQLAEKEFPVSKGEQELTVDFGLLLDASAYYFIAFEANPLVKLGISQLRLSGLLTVFNRVNLDVAKGSRQEPPEGLGVDTFDFWLPERRPGGQNLAIACNPQVQVYRPENLFNGTFRPTTQTNAWVTDPKDPEPTLTFSWPEQQKIRKIVLWFDTDFDHPLESTLRGHDERVMPFCVREFRLFDEIGTLLYQEADNHQSRYEIVFGSTVTIKKLVLQLQHPGKNVPAGLFGIGVYES